jgi:NAD(P)H-nitrite reductase large subunit
VNLDDTICYCFHVSKRKILNYLRVHRPRRVSELSQCGGAGTGCGWCRKYLQRCFDSAQQASAPGVQEDRDLTPEEYARGRQEYIAAGHGKPPSGA